MAQAFVLIIMLQGWTDKDGSGSTGNAITAVEYTNEAQCNIAKDWVLVTGVQAGTKAKCFQK